MYKSVLASLAIEGLTPSKEAQKWTKQFLKGEIDGDEVRYRIYKKYKIVLED